MRINGMWLECDDGIFRPVMKVQTLRADGEWQHAYFLVDTGADWTVFAASLTNLLGFSEGTVQGKLGGVGGITNTTGVNTRIQLRTDEGNVAVFRGTYAALTSPEVLDISVLGRDVLNHFALIVDRPGNVVSLLAQQHKYTIAVH